MAWRPLNFIHLGARRYYSTHHCHLLIYTLRSPLHTLDDFIHVVQHVQRSQYCQFVGVMGYEAQIAGLTDSIPFATITNLIKRFIKYTSFKDVLHKRQQIKKWLTKEGISLEFFNGGGSGNSRQACSDNSLTEVTVGSGLLQSILFDYFQDNECHPALMFALQVTRFPSSNSVVCQNGGFIAR